MGMAHSSSAFAPRRIDAEREFTTAGRDARIHRNVTWATPASARLGALTGWRGLWDRDTDVPLRLWGPAIAAPGTAADPAVAEATARQFLADHLDLLAPGALLGDFTLVANQMGSGDVRTVAFEQRRNGLRVLGGSIGFAFKGDHLSMVSSTALPDVTASVPTSRLTNVGIAANAITWLAGSGRAVRARTAPTRASLLGNAGERMILPIVHDRPGQARDIEYRVVETVTVESPTRTAGRWQVFVDAATGAPVARQNVLETFTGTLKFDTTDQSPTETRSDKAAPFLTTLINGQSVTADGNGVVTFTGADPATVQMSLTGQFVAVTDATSALASDTLSLASGGSLTWSHASDAPTDAQLDAYVAASRAKAFVKARLNPDLAWLDQQLSVTVNENDVCNAFSTGDDVHFFKAGSTQGAGGATINCENTGRMADVVSHETGHSVHNNSVIPGQGAFGTAGASSLSEGLADTLGVSISGDHGLGRGFFFTNDPLRDLDPVGLEKKWPQDADGEPHDEGEIIGEALWDLRTALVTKLGDQAGFAQLLKIYYGIMQRSPDIPSSYAEALLADDDDGNLANGTPNQCEIDTAFALHGLADAATALGLTAPTRTGFQVGFPAPVATGNCALAATVSSASLVWHVRGGTDATLPLDMTSSTYSATIPTQPDGSTVSYQVTITLDNGSVLSFPDNPADPYYEFYVGTATPIYCIDFESGFADWTHSGTKDEWEVGTPQGLGGDPKVAHAGTNAAGIDLGLGSGSSVNGQYRTSANESLVSPVIDLMGNTTVHLQYYRWLTVEDATFDKASIASNGTEVWSNLLHGTAQDGSDEINHLDKEWVFEDVDLTPTIKDGKVQLTFGLTSDQGEDFGGWTIDDVCVVAVAPAPPGPGVCGNGTVDSGETCDDGNTTDGDGCSATCQTEATPPKDDGGCCSVGGSPSGAATLSLLTLGLVLRRRKRK